MSIQDASQQSMCTEPEVPQSATVRSRKRLTSPAAFRTSACIGITAKLVMALVMALAALLSAADATYIQMKAVLSQHLIEKAWNQTLQAQGTPHKPWPWADTAPVARLQLGDASVDTWVLNGTDGTSMAFAPGMAAGSARLGDRGVVVIGAHRDTHFKNLKNAGVGDIIRVQDAHRQWHRYRITQASIADIRTQRIAHRHDSARLLLVTCYPFDALIPGGPLRFVLDAELVESDTLSS